MCFGFGALQRALRRPHVATVSVKCRLTNGWRLRRKQKDVLFQSLVAKWPFTAPPDLYHVNEETDTISRERQVKVKLLTTNNAFCIVRRATAQTKTGVFVIMV
jgi:hypothetical protein